MVVHNGVPALIISNCDPWFTSRFWRSLISALGCKHSLSTTFHHERDGLCKLSLIKEGQRLTDRPKSIVHNYLLLFSLLCSPSNATICTYISPTQELWK